PRRDRPGGRRSPPPPLGPRAASPGAGAACLGSRAPRRSHAGSPSPPSVVSGRRAAPRLRPRLCEEILDVLLLHGGAGQDGVEEAVPRGGDLEEQRPEVLAEEDGARPGAVA